MDRGVECTANLHYQTDVPVVGSEPSAQEVLDHLDDHFSTSAHNLLLWRNCLQNGAKLVETKVYEEVEPGSGDPPTGAVNAYDLAGLAGTLGTDAPPVELCVYISLTTSKLGRSFRGGVHGPPLAGVGAFDTDGTVQVGSSGMIPYPILGAAIVDALDNVFDSTGDINPVIYSRTRRARGLSFTQGLNGYRVNTKFRWLRRRATAP